MDAENRARLLKMLEGLQIPLRDYRQMKLHARSRHGEVDEELSQLPEIQTAADLIADAGRLPPMLVDRLLPDRSLFLLTGKPKAGKSFLALDIADCVCRGTPVLGTLAVNRPGPVLYLAMEDGKIELARRLTRRAHHSSNTPSELGAGDRELGASSPPELGAGGRIPPRLGGLGGRNLYFISEAFSLTDPLHYARFREKAQALQPSLIVIDTAAEALDIGDWINRAEILAKIAPVRRLARAICTILLVAHNRKAEGDMGDEIAGSNALTGAVDGRISAHKVERRANGNRRLHLRIEGRGGVGHEIVAEMDHDTLHFSLIPPEQLDADVISLRQGVRAARRLERRALAHQTLRDLGERPITIAELAVAMGIAYSVAWPLVREMSAAGEIEEIKNPAAPDGAGRKSPAYRLRQPDNLAI